MGYALPDLEAIDGEVCVSLRLPNEPNYLRAFWGQFFDLANVWNWGTEPTRDHDERSRRRAVGEYWRQVYATNRDANIFYTCNPRQDDDAPYWDDAESVAGEGEGEKWGWDEAADWVVAAFLATSVHPTAGVFYKTVIPKGRIAFKSHDYGALVRILIDGILGIEVDTASTVPGVEEIIEVEIDFQQFAADHDLPPGERTIRIEKAA